MTETGPKPFVFVLMPFQGAFDDIYKLGIKAAAEEAGAYAERVDEQMYDGSVLTRIYNQIAKADIIVSDMTGKSPNVFYETGYAHALDQRVILLTQDADDIPFDLKHHPHIIYEGSISNLKEQLFRSLVWAIENPRRPLGEYCPNLEFSIGGVSLHDSPNIQCTIERSQASWYIPMKVDAFNPVERELQTATFQLSLVTSAVFSGNIPDHRRQPNKAATTVDGRRVHAFERIHTIMPGAWIPSIQLDLSLDIRDFAIGKQDLTLRVISDGRPLEIPFTVEVLG